MKKLMFRTTIVVVTTFATLVVVGLRSDARRRQLPEE